MRRLTLVSYSLLFASHILFVGCGTDEVCHLTVSGARSGDALRLFDYRQGLRLTQIDSATFEATSVQVPIDCASGTRLLVATLPGAAYTFVAEPGELTLDATSGHIEGGKLNGIKEAYEREALAAQQRAAASYDSVATLEHSDPDEQRRQLGELIDRERRQAIDRAMRVVLPNADNALGAYVFWRGVAQNGTLDAEEVLRQLDRAGQRVADFPPVASAAARCRQLLRTNVGEPFLNVSLDSDSLGDKLGVGVNTLVHVFDPYNERTPLNFVALHRLSRQWGPQLCLVSVAEWADTALAARVAVRMKAKWPVLADKQGNLAAQYGLVELPHYMVIGPQGDIRARGIDQDALDNWFMADARQ